MLDLGKYVVPILASWGVTLGIVALLIWISWRQAVTSKRDLDAAEARRKGNG